MYNTRIGTVCAYNVQHEDVQHKTIHRYHKTTYVQHEATYSTYNMRLDTICTTQGYMFIQHSHGSISTTLLCICMV